MKYEPIRIAKGVRPKKDRPSAQTRSRTADESQGAQPMRQRPGAAGESFQGTVIYVHGIANKPKASVLKCQWDRALFGTGMGQRSRMVYWVNRDRYPDAFPATCNDGDFSEGPQLAQDNDDEALQDDSRRLRMELAEKQARRLLRDSDQTEKGSQATASALTELADSIEANTKLGESQTRKSHPELLLLPNWKRDRLTRMFSKYLLNDVYDYFFDPVKAREIDRAFLSRMSGGGPYVVVGHSLGSVIAYRNLCQSPDFEPDSVRLFVTIGSPMGLQTVQERLKQKLKVQNLTVPDCIQNWVNIADPLDPVAADRELGEDFLTDAKIQDIRVMNLDSPRHPHSATGYLGLQACQQPVRAVVGAAFAQPISSFTVARDLTDQVEDSLTMSSSETSGRSHSPTHPVLIEVNERKGGDLKAAQNRLLQEIEQALGAASLQATNLVLLKRYLAADLTSLQIELLGPILQRESVGRIWSNSEKMSLGSPLAASREDPIQSAAASRIYGADGAGIHWAVLDTGVQSAHPHFETFGNIEAEWDCTHADAVLDSPNANSVDQHGHGTHVAAIIAGTVMRSSSDAQARHGVAPKTRIHSYKVLDDRGRGRDSYIIRALDHIASLNEAASSNVIHGINLSLGGAFDPETYGCGHSPICRELRRLWRQGVLIVVAAGNAGFAELQSSRGSLRANLDLSIGDPANLEEAIAVGSVHLAKPLTYGTSYFSSRGPTADGRQKPDLVAPGERVRSANFAFEYSEEYIELSGTSMAAPHVSGLLAAFLSQRQELLGETERVKSILLANCTDLGRDPYVQGAGLPNLVRMLLAT